MRKRFIVGCLLVLGVVLSSVWGVMIQAAQAQATGPELRATELYTIVVKDQFGTRTPGATVMCRCYYPGDSHAVQGSTNVLGEAYLWLNPERRYSCSVYYTDRGTMEYWRYDYVHERGSTIRDDWRSPRQTWQRRDPWIASVTLPTEPVGVGQAAQVVATVGQAYQPDDAFGLFLRAHLWIDDDGQPPYLFEALSAEEPYVQGYQPFSFGYTPEQAGHYVVRVLFERKWESDENWIGSDEGGWAWSLDVASEPFSIAGRVYGDLNRDGAYQGNEPLVMGAQVILYDGQEVAIAQQTSGDLGEYRFTVLVPGLYRVALGQVPAGLTYAGQQYEQDCGGGQSYEGFDFPLGLWYLGVPLVYGAHAP